MELVEKAEYLKDSEDWEETTETLALVLSSTAVCMGLGVPIGIAEAVVPLYKRPNPIRRVWAAENISWQLTRLLHVFPGEDPFDQKIRQSDYDRLLTSETAARALAHDYIGLPFED